MRLNRNKYNKKGTMKKFGIIIALFSSVLLASCCGTCRVSGSKQVAALLNSSWQVNELMGVSVNKVMNDSYTFQFDTKRGSAFGRGDCNRFFASYSLKGKNSITFSTIGNTKMACQNEDDEMKFFSVLKRTTGFIINDGELLLLDKGNVVAVLTTFATTSK